MYSDVNMSVLIQRVATGVCVHQGINRLETDVQTLMSVLNNRYVYSNKLLIIFIFIFREQM